MQKQSPSAAGVTTGKVIRILFLAAWMVFVLTYVVNMIRAGERESVVSVTPEHVSVESAHGVRIPIAAITAVELKDEMPKIKRKVRGYNSFSCVRKGEFKLEGMGVARIYIFTRNGPFLHISMGSQFVIIAFEDPAKTRRLHDQIALQRQ